MAGGKKRRSAVKPETGYAALSIFGVLWSGWKEHHQIITNFTVLLGLFVTLAGVWATVAQIKISATNFNDQLGEQRRATSVMLVSDFLNQVGAHTIESNYQADIDSSRKLAIDRLIVTRAQLLFDTLDIHELKSQLLRYLGGNGYGHLFQPDPSVTGFDQKPAISMRNVVARGVISGEFVNATFTCAILADVTLDSMNFRGADLIRSEFDRARIGPGSSFAGSNIQWASFRGSQLLGKPNFEGAAIVFSDLRNITFSDSTLQTLLSQNGMDNTDENLRKVRYKTLAKIFSGVETLYGTLIDKELEDELQREWSSGELTEKRRKVPKAFSNVDSRPNSTLRLFEDRVYRYPCL